MAMLLAFGAETGNIATDIGDVAITGLLLGGASITSSVSRSGSRSYDMSVASGGSNSINVSSVPLGLTPAFWCMHYRIDTFPGNTPFIYQGRIAGVSIVAIAINPSGQIQLWNGVSAQVGSSSAALVSGQWHRIELSLTVTASGGNDTFVLLLDGNTVATISGSSLTDSAIDQQVWGWVTAPTGGGTFPMYLDDCAINDNTGATNNTWVGNHSVVVLLPTADSSNTSFTGGTGATTSLFDAVNNVPPVGVAVASETNTSQIKSVVATTPQYTATMQTYTAAGVPPGAVVNWVRGVASVGQEVTTGVRNGSLQILTNPVEGSATTLEYNETAGTAAAAFPTGWASAKTVSVQQPTVVLGTAPTLQIKKTDSGTRADDCCFMGIIVSYTSIFPPLPNHPFVMSNTLIRM